MLEGREESRDILIELRTDVKHMLQTMGSLKASDIKQWEKLDDLGQKVEGHRASIGSLTKGFWVAIGALVSSAGGVLVWLVTH